MSIEQRKSVKADSVKVAESVSISLDSIEGHPQFSAFQNKLEALDRLVAEKQASQSQLSPLETAAMDLSQVCHAMAPGISVHEDSDEDAAIPKVPAVDATALAAKASTSKRPAPTSGKGKGKVVAAKKACPAKTKPKPKPGAKAKWK